MPKRLKHYVTFCEWSNFHLNYVTIMIPKRKKLLAQITILLKLNFLNFLTLRDKLQLKTIFFSGPGLHTGKQVKMTLTPAPPNTGIVLEKR